MLITSSGWGFITVGDRTFRDLVITPDECFSWDWKYNPTNPMRHNPGIRTVDLDVLILPSKPEVVVLSRGRDLVLQVNPSLDGYLKNAGVKLVYILETSEAINKCNELAKSGTRFAALIHTTC